ncbi:RecBCD enzyme subunit RecD [Pigmentiphaga litoralis]|uniref:exodeoxyribonuclease V subunit alpha n=1 Tax=Pigmentiphaga litoralis TaxID=516702 RepID=UPI001988F45A|nr:exodeoxyribonuclease V subunit alpha [Pigmentiphaga litoralis]GGX05525.1 RecBCD enzyme subunit RecD [Pigmentiphaga litoralis]
MRKKPVVPEGQGDLFAGMAMPALEEAGKTDSKSGGPANLAGKDAAAQDPAAKIPAAKIPDAKKPAGKNPDAKPPAANDPAANKPAEQDLDVIARAYPASQLTPDDGVTPPPHAAAAAPSGHLDDSASLLTVLDQWTQRGWLRALDLAFVGFLDRLRPGADPRLLVAAALASHQLGHGHVCLDLGATLDSPDFALSLPPEGDTGRGPTPLPSDVLAGLDVETWRAALAASPLVEQVDGTHLMAGNDPALADRPMVLLGHRLYLRRYWRYERRVGDALRARLSLPPAPPPALAASLGALFPRLPDEASAAAGHPSRTDWQKLACALAARGAFSIITGGPGTGKTTTVIRLLALLQRPGVEAGQPLRIRLAAPTGKAAARLSTSIGEQVSRLDVAQDVRAAIPTDVTTLHRLLGNRPDSRHFRHHAGHLLPLDVLVIDEASMVDLEMMASVLDALPLHARLVLLGDKDQLASVEAGAVLGDLCRDAEAGRYSDATRAWLEAVSGDPVQDPQLLPGTEDDYPLAQQTVMLRLSRRFGEGSGIGRLARDVNAADADAAQSTLEALSRHPDSDTRHIELERSGAKALETLALDGYGHYLDVLQRERPPVSTGADDPAWAAWASAVLAAFDTFQLLCAVRKGDYGVERLNARIESALAARGWIDTRQAWYEGRPVLVTRNDYGLGLMNGDVGIALMLPEAQTLNGAPREARLRVAFPRNDGSGALRFVLPSRLGAIETVYAMTVHKAQGSEFAHTALILPEALNPVLTKELIYTGITRAKTRFTLIEPRRGVFRDAVGRRVKRLSGLVMHLSQGDKEAT